MSRSTSLLGPHVSSSAARAGAPVTRTAPDCGTRNISNALHGAALRPGMAFPNNHGIHDFGSGVKTLCNLFHKAAVRPGMVVPKNRGIHGYAARSSCSRPAAAKTSWPTTGMPSIIKKRTTPTFADSVTGSKRGLSSTASNKHKPSEKAKMADQQDTFKRRVHDLTPSLWFNTFTAWTIYAGVYVMINDDN